MTIIKRTHSHHVIAATLGWDAREVSECRYQSTRTKQAIYSIGSRYFAVSPTVPADKVGGDWRENNDQFFAQRAGTVMWVADAATEDAS